MRFPAILPGTGYTTKPGVAALRRTPGDGTEKGRTPTGFHNGVRKTTGVVWNPVGVQSQFATFPGVRRWHGDPRLCCATPLGSIAIVRLRWGPERGSIVIGVCIDFTFNIVCTFLFILFSRKQVFFRGFVDQTLLGRDMVRVSFSEGFACFRFIGGEE